MRHHSEQIRVSTSVYFVCEVRSLCCFTSAACEFYYLMTEDRKTEGRLRGADMHMQQML